MQVVFHKNNGIIVTKQRPAAVCDISLAAFNAVNSSDYCSDYLITDYFAVKS